MAYFDAAEPPLAGHAPRLRIETFDQFAVRYGGREVLVNGRKARALLAYLALSETGEETRERLAGLLWSETDEAKARASLRQAIYEIREAFQAVGFDRFDADKHSARIDPTILEVDLWDVLNRAEQGEPHPILLKSDRATENLLRELETVDTSFRNWLRDTRRALHARLVVRLEAVLRGGPAAAGVEHAAHALARLDPANEEAARALIRVRMAAGDASGAIAVYRSLRERLGEEYDVEPAQETQALINALREQHAGSQVFFRREDRAVRSADAAPTATPPAKLIIAVPPFDTNGACAGNRPFIEAFRSEFIASLVRFREWTVRSEDPPAVVGAPAAPGTYVIDTSAFEAGETVRLVLMLRNVESSEYIWSERFHIALDNWHGVQQAIVSRLATALQAQVAKGRLAAEARDSDPLAFDLWLQGQSLLLNHTPADWQRGFQLIGEAIRRMPTYSPAHCGLANAYNTMHLALPGLDRDAQRTRLALQHAREAVRCDPVNSRAQLCLAWSYAMAGDFEQAKVHARNASGLNDADAWTRVSSTNCLALSGATEEARAMAGGLLAKQQLISPKEWAFHATTCFLLGDYEGCVEAAERGGDSYHLVPAWRASALALLGRRAEAGTEVARFLRTIAERWAGSGPVEPTAVARWLLDAHPFALEADRERLRRGTAAAGLAASPGTARGNR